MPLQTFIVNRNRFTSLRKMVEWLLGFDVEIVILDNDSSYPPLLQWYRDAPVDVIRFNENFGYLVGWETNLLGRMARGDFVLTDPDLDLSSIPPDWQQVLARGLAKHGKNKCGFSLEINNLPDHYHLKQSVIDWESHFWQQPLDGEFYDAEIDTTFALYRHECAKRVPTRDAVRTIRPYTAKHVPWYVNSQCLSEEEQYYVEHASASSSWTAQMRSHPARSIWSECEEFRIQQKRQEWEEFLGLIPGKKNLILEIGPYDGGTTIGLSHFARKLVSVDALPPRFDIERIQQHCEFHYVTGDSHEAETIDRCRKLIGDEKVDVLFIDGDHSYDGVSADFEHYRDLVKEGGLIAFHDIVESDYHRSAGCEVARLWQELKHTFTCREIRHGDPGWGGMGVIENRRQLKAGNAFVFASFIPNDAALEIGRQFLNLFATKFKDCDIYIGINHGSIPQWKSLIEAWNNPRCRWCEATWEMTIDSDASAFQAALTLMAEAGKRYEVVWFGHSKGVTNPWSHAIREEIIREFLGERQRIETLFTEDPTLGAYGRWVTLGEGAVDEGLDRLFPFPRPRVGPYFLHTFYAMRGKVVGDFLAGCRKEFFTQNLITCLGFDRYFFERDFPALAEKMGYDFRFDQAIVHPVFHIPVDDAIIAKLKRERSLIAAD